MNIDVPAHYMPPDSLKVASEIGRSPGLKLAKNERGRDLLTRDGKLFSSQPKAEFFDLDLRLSIMDQQGVDMQVMSPASSFFIYWMPVTEALECARWLNECLAEAVAKQPSRLLARFPRLKFLLAHAGGFLPYTWGRLDRGYSIQDSAAAKIPMLPGEYVKLLYFDTITHSRTALEYLVANFGPEHVLLGSDYPYDMGDPEPLASLHAAAIGAERMAQIAGANACKLLRIGI